MNKILLLSCVCTFVMAGCSSSERACEDITLASEQIQECKILQRQIVQAKGKPLLRTELERRYEQDCINGRYYRDDHKAPVCEKQEEMTNHLKEATNKK